jgi:uncharacterized protein (DUF169 family)
MGVNDMEIDFKNRFMDLWNKYFGAADLPVTFYYSNEAEHTPLAAKAGASTRCVIGSLVKIQRGESLAFNADAVGCPGGKRYLGFTENPVPNFAHFLSYFLSCGIPGQMEGERYKKTPELVKEYTQKHAPAMAAPAEYIVFKRWDNLATSDTPEVVVFFAPPDVLSGLFTLAIYDEAEPNAVIAPFGSGCASIVQYPYLETKSDKPRAVIGLFDVSARPYVPPDVLTFSVPLTKFTRMVDNMEESFLITPSWDKIRKRLK